MAISKAILATIFLCVLAFHLVHAIESSQEHSQAANFVAEAGVTEKMDCGTACAGRCKLSSRPRLCKRACGTCCGRCNCVPPGTSGNYETCSCYANMTTRHNKRKCP